jgi:hypothetical protein
MGKGFIFLCSTAFQFGAFQFAAVYPVQAQSQSEEAFINQVFRTVVDSSFDHYNLYLQAAPCSFIKYDYDEWLTYALRETVPIYTLNELAKQAHDERNPRLWRQDSLTQARCIDRQQADSILDPARALRADTLMRKNKRRRAVARAWAAWSRIPEQDRIVFYFSRPVFTDDRQYALLDMDYRCDNRLCGQGAICLFRREGGGWKLIGKRIK